MRPLSAEALRILRGSHVIDVRARIVEGMPTGVEPDGTEIGVTGGDVTHTASADVRSTLDMTTPGIGWTPKPGEPITPYGNEVFVERAVVHGDGRREWVSQGYYRIYAADQDEAPDGDVRIEGRDRMSGLIDARLLGPIQFTAGTSIGDVFEQLVTEVYPAAVIEWLDVNGNPDGSELVPLSRSYVAEEDRYGFLRDIAKARAKVMYWDHRGVLVVKTPPNPSQPVVEVNAGENGVLVKLRRSVSREGVYNAVVATGEALDTAAPARGVAYDLAPLSPTYWHGPFGKVPRFYSSTFITTNGQAASTAAMLLQQSLGLPYSVSFGMVPNPALEPLDPVRISTRQSTEVHILDRITVPLDPESPMTADTRELTDVNVGTE